MEKFDEGLVELNDAALCCQRGQIAFCAGLTPEFPVSVNVIRWTEGKSLLAAISSSRAFLAFETSVFQSQPTQGHSLGKRICMRYAKTDQQTLFDLREPDSCRAETQLRGATDPLKSRLDYSEPFGS